MKKKKLLGGRFNDLVGSENANKAKQMASSIVRMGKVSHGQCAVLLLSHWNLCGKLTVLKGKLLEEAK